VSVSPSVAWGHSPGGSCFRRRRFDRASEQLFTERTENINEVASLHGNGMEHYRQAYIGRDIPASGARIAGKGPAVPDLKLLATVQELRNRAEEARIRAESFRDLETKRLMLQVAETYEEVARRLEREARAGDEA
jgi:hypothetical protein